MEYTVPSISVHRVSRTGTELVQPRITFIVEMLQYQHLNPVYDGFSIWVYIAEVTLYLIITYFTVVTVTD